MILNRSFVYAPVSVKTTDKSFCRDSVATLMSLHRWSKHRPPLSRPLSEHESTVKDESRKGKENLKKTCQQTVSATLASKVCLLTEEFCTSLHYGHQ